MVRRLLKAYGRRVADADDVDLAELVKIRELLDDVITQAVTIQREKWGRSWADIGRAMGTTRQGASQWAKRREAAEQKGDGE